MGGAPRDPAPRNHFLVWVVNHQAAAAHVHPVSITRFPLRIFSPGAGLLRNRFCHR